MGRDDRILQTDVLIVGAGGCGLVLSNLLVDYGVDFLTIERRRSTGNLPRAHYLNQRTMEIFRQHGIADEVYKRGTPPENMSVVKWYTSLGGDGPLDRRTIFETDSLGGGPNNAHIYARDSACRASNLPLKDLEPFLHGRLDERAPGRLRFEHELVGLEQDNNGVRASVRTAGGRDLEIQASWLIAADGGRTIGELVGNPTIGEQNLIETTTVHFAADLSEYWIDDRVMLNIFIHPERRAPLKEGFAQGGMVPVTPPWNRYSREFMCTCVLPPDVSSIDEETAAAWMKDLLKLPPDFELTVLSALPWTIAGVVAERFQLGRVVFAGDAAHRHPPTSGIGLNTGIQDAHNLAWKLSAVVKGLAGSQLLDTYEPERQPVGHYNVMWALTAFFNRKAVESAIYLSHPPARHEQAGFSTAVATMLKDTPEGRLRNARLQQIFGTARAEYEDHDVEIGFTYAEGALIPDGTEAPPRDPIGTTYVPTTRPGHRLPHAWLLKDGHRLSTHDLLGRQGEFVLIANERGQVWCEAAEELAADTGVPIVAARIARDAYIDSETTWEKVSGFGPSGAILVRPDGMVAWRAQELPPDPKEALTSVLDQILTRDSRGHAGVTKERVEEETPVELSVS